MCKTARHGGDDVKGTGKTAVMRAMVGFEDNPGWIQAADPNARSVTSSFNEAGSSVSNFRNDCKKLGLHRTDTAFGRHILRYYKGMREEDVQRIGSFKTAVFLLRKKLGQTIPGTLVIGIDELAMIEGEAAKVVSLMQQQDSSIRYPDEYEVLSFLSCHRKPANPQTNTQTGNCIKGK